VVGIDAERQGAGAVDAIGLLRKFGYREHAEVGCGQHAERTDRAREHHRLEAEIAGKPLRYPFVNLCRKNAAMTFDDRAQPVAACSPIHSPPLLVNNRSVPF
jgi:hypothetical protein